MHWSNRKQNDISLIKMIILLLHFFNFKSPTNCISLSFLSFTKIRTTFVMLRFHFDFFFQQLDFLFFMRKYENGAFFPRVLKLKTFNSANLTWFELIKRRSNKITESTKCHWQQSKILNRVNLVRLS